MSTEEDVEDDQSLLQSTTQHKLLPCSTPVDRTHPIDSCLFNNEGAEIANKVAENKMIRAIIESQLLPKIFKSEHHLRNYWLEPDTFDDNTAETIIGLASMITKRCEKRMCELMGTSFMSPKKNINLPTFRKHSINPTNKQLISALVRDLITLSQRSPKHALLTTKMENGKTVPLIRVPKCADKTSMQQNKADYKWLNHLFVALGPQKREWTPMFSLLNENDEESRNDINAAVAKIHNKREKNEQEWGTEELTLRHLIGLLGTKYPKSFQWAVNKHFVGVVNPVMDKIATFAMLSNSNINYMQAQIVSHHPRVWFGKPIMSSTSKLKKRLTNNNPRQFVEPQCATQKFNSGSEVVDWSVRDPVRLLLFFLDGVFNRKQTNLKWNCVDIVVSCNHGKGFSRAHVVFICRSKNNKTGDWSEYSDLFSLAQARCNKNSYEVLEKTFMPKVNKDLSTIQEQGGFNVWKQGQAINHSQNDTGDKESNEDCVMLVEYPFYTSLWGTPKQNESDELVYKTIPWSSSRRATWPN